MAGEDNSVRSLARGLAILRSLSKRGSASLAELHADTQISRPAILRLLHTLEVEGYARRWLSDGRYRINSKVTEIAKAPHWSAVVADVVGPTLVGLLDKLSWPTDIAVADGALMVLCETTRRQSPHMINAVAAGYRVHMLQSAVGRAYLTFCASKVRTNILEALKLSTDPLDRISRDAKAVEGMTSEIKKLGYALRARGYQAVPHALPLEFSAAALPILVNNTAVACISVTWIATAISPDKFMSQHLETLQEAASGAAKALQGNKLSRRLIEVQLD